MTELNPQASLIPSSPSGDSAGASDDQAVYFGLSLETWVKVAILSPLFIAVYWVVLRWLWDKTNPIWGEANWGHAIVIPLVGLYYLYINRDELLKQPVQPAWLGLPITILGLLAFAYGIWPGQNQFFQGCAMILTLFGIVLLLTGWKVMKFAWFPIIYLVCGIPWPPLVYSYIASPLQTLAAKAAVVTLRFTGVNAYRSGTKINMGGITEPMRSLNVAEACAGLRSLMTFITVGMAVAFLSARPLWQKIIISASAVPIAIFCNVMRVAGQGLLDHYVSRQLSESFAHQFVGMVMLVPAFFMILMVGWLLDHLFIEEVDKPGDAPGRVAGYPQVSPAGSLVTDIPRKATTAAVRPAAASAPAGVQRATPPVSSVSKPAVSAQSTGPAVPPSAKPSSPMTPPRPGIVPPRPGIIPPRPNSGPTPPRQQGGMPVRPKPPTQPPKEGA